MTRHYNPIPILTEAQRLALISKIDRSGKHPDDCWQWMGTISPNGYGKARVWDSTAKVMVTTSAHRLVWAVFQSPPPTDKDVDHRCGNRLCCRPSHLRLLSHVDNIMASTGITARNAQATECLNGHTLLVGHPNVRVTVDAKGNESRVCRACTNERMRRYRNGTSKPVVVSYVGMGSGANNREKTHCARGHEFNEENTRTRVTARGQHRQCRICVRLNRRVARQVRNAKAAS